ncbi:MAG: flagellar biosynthesis protein FliQ [Planctomycetes bacterium]|jgi:flagellar biosynthetic protein FliQ|nr:flagellar biosynthesis protein FliQ [Planctomycetota bacterium]MCC7396765.1 flagellar biosynthesis protein FliQ [Planctomycetota bacterium]
MGHETLLDLAKSTLMTALMICAPALLVGMVVGLCVSFFQTITSLQEQTLTIVPKMLAVLTTIVLLMPWILGALRDYTAALFQNLAAYGLSG